MTDVAILTERVTSLAARVSELLSGYKEIGEEFKDYRHSVRGELQRIVNDISLISYDRDLRGKDLDRLHLMVDGLAARIGSLETDRTERRVERQAIGWIWGSVVGLCGVAAGVVGDFVVRRYG